MNPAQVMQRLADIEADLDKRQNEWESAAGDQITLKRDWERRFAEGFVSQDPKLTVQERKARALVALATAEDDLYERYTAAEASAEAKRAVVNVLQTRATIGQSILRALTQRG